MRNVLIALLLLLWLILGWLFHKDYHQCCTTTPVSEVSAVIEKTGPLLFNWGNGTPILGEGWPKMRDSLSSSLGVNQILEITGWYCENASPEETDSTGYHRARELRKLFPELADERIILYAKSVVCDSTFKTHKFEAASLATRIMTENIKEIDDVTLIYFPSNSTKKLNSSEVESYLNDVAERVTESGETISLTGHSDSVGDEEPNRILAQKRADIVRDYLISKGVPASKITSVSKGETSPISENDTPEGRAKNRRTELQIIK